MASPHSDCSHAHRAEALTDAVSISIKFGGFPLGPFLDMYASFRTQYLAMTSTLPSTCIVRCSMNERKYVSKFLDGGKLIRSTQSNCHPRKTLSLYRAITCEQKRRGSKKNVRIRIPTQLLHNLTINLIPQLPMQQSLTQQPPLLLQHPDARRRG
jgi:hypothetical protein